MHQIVQKMMEEKNKMKEEKEKEEGKHVLEYLYVEPWQVCSPRCSPPTLANFCSLKEEEIDLDDVFKRQQYITNKNL